ncbi:MAG: 23S rRNA (guanosine(2251)-2'-O)-methyltransferase RlmB [Clostridiales bacterium]|nr:23S rRNA (guanosine(2251)-2'-O)-methyltransferase RlmB [Clostridiales bacterium]
MNKGSEDFNSSYIEGRNSVNEALNAGHEINKIWILKPADGRRLDPDLAKILAAAKERHLVVVRVQRSALDKMSTTGNHQGVIAQVSSHEYADVEDILARAEEEGRAPLIIAMDEIKDSFNFASLLRISDAAGVDGIIIPKHRSIALNSIVSKLSAGAVEYVPVARVTNLAQTLRDLKENHGFWVCGTDMEGSVPYDKADYKGPLVIVVGSEGEGMRKSIRSECDFCVHIPMNGHVNSLNAAVATGIIVYEAVKCRRGDD